MKTFAVIPAYNEQGRIAEVVRSTAAFVDAVVVIDDASVDRTADEAASAGAEVLVHVANRGQGAALRTGTEYALLSGAAAVVHIDADGQHDPSLIPELIKPLREGNSDVVFGSRFLGIEPVGMPAARRALLGMARAFNVLVLGIPSSVTDPQSGLRAMSAKAAKQVDFRQDRMAHCSEILKLVVSSDLSWAEVPVRVRYTQDTLSKGQKATDALRIVWQLFLGAFRN